MPEHVFEPITNQHMLEDSYGNGFSRSNGCAWIAAYNILLLTGNYMSASVVKKSLIDMGGLILRGKFGTKPKTVYRFLKQHLNSKYIVAMKYGTSSKNAEAFASGSDYVIVTSFWYSSVRGDFLSLLKNSNAAAHTFAGKKIDAAKFGFYNETYHNKVACTISDLFKDKGDATKYRRSFPVCIISLKTRSVPISHLLP
ncbi:MAG: hypothetical protein ACYCYM_13355 [Saccharofermentanales bacterium]